MDRIAELLARLQDLSPEELVELQGLIDTEFDRLAAEDENAETIGELGKVVEAAETAAAEVSRRAEVAEETARAAEELRSRMKLLRTPVEETQTPTEDGEEAVPVDEEGKDPEAKTPPAAAAGQEGLDKAAAGAGRVARMAAQQGRPKAVPGRTAHFGTVLTAGPGLRNVSPGAPVEDRMTLAEGMAEQLSRMNRQAASNGDVMVASAAWTYPEGRRLTRSNSAEANASILEGVVSYGAITASGGTCSPVNVDYSVPTWAGADRPIRDGLAAFSSDRGGIMFVPPPDISALAGATAVWTEATDASPGTATKPVLTINCGTVTTVYVDAIPTRLQFGNMQGRFAPEQIAANTDLAIAAAARIAELNLQAKIDSSCTKVTAAAYLGATRDLLAAIDLSAAAYRYRHRIPRSVSLTAIFPDWTHDMLRADVARELAHSTSGGEPLALSDSDIEAFFTARGIKLIFSLDGRAANALGGSTNPLQGWGTQSAGAILGWPAELDWNLFVDGTFQFLDGGRLDLGVVRDATLDSTNDYETFVETFEGVAFRGIEALVIRSTLTPNGATAGTVAVTGYAE
jgi:hypothetical protein